MKYFVKYNTESNSISVVGTYDYISLHMHIRLSVISVFMPWFTPLFIPLFMELSRTMLIL